MTNANAQKYKNETVAEVLAEFGEMEKAGYDMTTLKQ